MSTVTRFAPSNAPVSSILEVEVRSRSKDHNIVVRFSGRDRTSDCVKAKADHQVAKFELMRSERNLDYVLFKFRDGLQPEYYPLPTFVVFPEAFSDLNGKWTDSATLGLREDTFLERALTLQLQAVSRVHVVGDCPLPLARLDLPNLKALYIGKPSSKTVPTPYGNSLVERPTNPNLFRDFPTSILESLCVSNSFNGNELWMESGRINTLHLRDFRIDDLTVRTVNHLAPRHLILEACKGVSDELVERMELESIVVMGDFSYVRSVSTLSKILDPSKLVHLCFRGKDLPLRVSELGDYTGLMTVAASTMVGTCAAPHVKHIFCDSLDVKGCTRVGGDGLVSLSFKSIESNTRLTLPPTVSTPLEYRNLVLRSDDVAVYAPNLTCRYRVEPRVFFELNGNLQQLHFITREGLVTVMKVPVPQEDAEME